MIIQHESGFEHTRTSCELTIHTESHNLQSLTRTCPEIREHFKESLPGAQPSRLWIYLAYRHLNTGRSHSISKEWEGVANAGGWPGAPVEEEIEGTINLESELPLLFSQPADGDHVDDDGDGDVDDDGDDYSSEHKCPTYHMVSSITTMRKGISSPQCRVPPGFCRNLSKRTNFLTSTNLMWGRHKSGVEASTNLAVHTNLLLVCINHPCFRKHPNRRQFEPNKYDNLLVSKTTVDLVGLMNKEH